MNLFCSSLSRIDFAGVSLTRLLSPSINEHLTLRDENLIYPGDGEKTTIGYKKQCNSILQGDQSYL